MVFTFTYASQKTEGDYPRNSFDLWITESRRKNVTLSQLRAWEGNITLYLLALEPLPQSRWHRGQDRQLCPTAGEPVKLCARERLPTSVPRVKGMMGERAVCP